MVRVVHTAVYWTNGCTLWLVMEAHAFRTLFVCDVVHVHVAGIVFEVGVDPTRRGVFTVSLEPGSIRKLPAGSAFVDSVVGTLGFTGTAVDAVVGYHNGHARVRSWVAALNLGRRYAPK